MQPPHGAWVMEPADRYICDHRPTPWTYLGCVEGQIVAIVPRNVFIRIT